MKKLKDVVVLFLVCFSLFPKFLYAGGVPEEVIRLQQKFQEHVDKIEIASSYEKTLKEKVQVTIFTNQNTIPTYSQYFLLVDRNPDTQIISLAFLNIEEKEVVILGSGKTSTGNPLRNGYYETPIGVFLNTPSNMSYRALGTRNSKGWRGFGVKGSRVWDLGWQKSKNVKNPDINIRMLIHATDPDAGEKRLGTRDSKGCIRLSAKFNYFLDHHGILDAEFEKNEKKKYILPKDREKVVYAGNLIVVVDSSL